MRIVEPQGRRRLAALGGAALAAVVLAWTVGLAQDRRESEAALSAVRKEIKELQDRIARESTRRDEGTRALRAAEVEIAAATRKLAEVRGDLKKQETARRELAQETQRANRRLASEKEALARQLRSSYRSGREELFKLLLSQESPAALGRMLVYFDYYNRARTTRIAAVATDLAKLDELEADTARIGLEDFHVRQARPQRSHQGRIDLERDQAPGPARQLTGERPLPGPDLDHEISRARSDGIDDGAGDTDIAEEVLAEGPPTAGGHRAGSGRRARRSAMSAACTRRT
jgi:septal ring factor EnvC (AmiA/AmiB activator)